MAEYETNTYCLRQNSNYKSKELLKLNIFKTLLFIHKSSVSSKYKILALKITQCYAEMDI